MRGRICAAVLVLGLGILAPRGPAPAAERVAIAIGGLGNMLYLPYDVAQAIGAFREEDLEVEFQYFRGGSQAASALVAGSVDFTGNSFDHAIKAALQGRTLTMIAAFNEVPGAQILVRSSLRDTVRDPRDLKGRPVGVTSLGSGSHMTLTYVLTRAGLRPDEINAVPVGFEALSAALENQRIQALVGVGLAAAALVDAGRAFVLVDLTARDPSERVFGGPYLNTGVMTRPEVCAARPDLCRRIVRAVVRANRWIATHPSGEVAGVLPDALVQDRRLYVKALETARDGFSRDGRVSRAAVETVINAHRAFGAIPADALLDATRLYDNTFVDEALARGR